MKIEKFESLSCENSIWAQNPKNMFENQYIENTYDEIDEISGLVFSFLESVYFPMLFLLQ